jgi:tetratricopeptide (TPR) repeat protein
VGSALAFAHSRGVVHRDIKPSNILFERATQRWLITDFGVAHAQSDGEAEITVTGVAVGTPAYMAPEQAAGRGTVDARSDLYALAAVAYEALTGDLPDLAASPDRLAQALASARRDLPRRVSEALMQPLAPDREARPASVEAWLDGLAAAERRGTMRPWTAVAVATAAGVLGWFALRDRPTPAGSQQVVAVLPFSLTGTIRGVPLDSVIPEAFVWQLQMLPELRVLGAAAVRRALVRRAGNEPQPLDTLLAMTGELGARLAVAGRGDASGGQLRLSIQVHDTQTRELVASADTAGPLDSLHTLVAGLVVQGFARELARERSGWPAPSLPRGLPAIATYFRADRDFRRGAYERAIEQFDRVIALDSTYAPAHFKRMLAVVQLNPDEIQIRSALRAAETSVDRLDPVSRQLLEGYAALVRRGDLPFAARAFREIVARYPDAVDAWFALAELQFHFAPLLGTPLSEAEATFQEVMRRDAWFAAPVAHLITLALARGDDDAVRNYMARYLEIDSTSVVADLVRAADTLLYRPERAGRVIASFPSRPRAFLENIAFVASEFGRSPAERSIGMRAVLVLWERAVSRDEKERAYRMRMAMLLGGGQEGSAARFLAEGAARGVPRDELDRWIVLSHVTPIPDLAAQPAAAAAAGRLAGAGEEAVVEQWLAARWFREHDAELAADLMQHLRQSLAGRSETPPVYQSLLDDLAAQERLAAGDTAGALATWRRATERYSIEQVPFALVASLWPLRLARVRYAAASGRYREALDASDSFVRIAAFVDQAAWPQILHLRADAALELGDTALAINTYADLVQILARPDGAGIAVRERAARALERLRGEARGGERR